MHHREHHLLMKIYTYMMKYMKEEAKRNAMPTIRIKKVIILSYKKYS